ncbi:MAG: hypothetical protein IIC89_04420, partial [Chloroflexi bacterium]|nr:hypothetical protein [Chloroflexota bacterium]
MQKQADHPNGPRTLWTQLRDGVGMPDEVVARGLALEAGRHPTLSELRAALGLDLDLSQVFVAARQHATPPDAPSDEELQILIDAMYRSLSSGRMARLEITAQGLVVHAPQEPIHVRENEALVLFIMADNRTGDAVEFGAEAHGERIRRSVEARRTASALLHCGPRGPGTEPIPLK